MSTTDLRAQIDDRESQSEQIVRSRRGEPTWEIARSWPHQGEWTEENYLAVRDRLDGLVELSDGCLEFLPMTVPFYHDIVVYLLERLLGHVRAGRLGYVYPAPLTLRLWQGKFREPDVVYLRPERVVDRGRRPEGADLAIEVVSPGDEARERDLDTKRDEYARAGTAEYWTVDPETRTIQVLTPDGIEAGGTYRVHGEFKPSDAASSLLRSGFAVSVDEVFAAGERENAATGRTSQ